MPVPSLITDLSTTPASNSPAGSENVFPNLDDYLRVQSAFLASIRDNSGNGWVSPYLTTAALASPPAIGGTTPAAGTFTNLTVNGTLSGAGVSTYLAAPPAIGGTTPAAISGTTGTFSGNVQMASANGGQLAGLRNQIINGNMGIFQRGTAAVTSGYGPADRWTTFPSGDTVSTTQGSFVSGDTLYDTGGAQYFTQIAVTSVANAANYCIFLQRIEDVCLLAGKTVTVSFWAKAASGSPSIGLEILQSFGTGGSPSADVSGTGQAQALTTTWTKYSKTFTVLSISGKTVGTIANTSSTYVNFWLDAASTFNTRSGSIGQASKTVSIAQVQVEVGPVATPFEQRPIGMELALCQRYFARFNALASTTARVGTNTLPVPMRTTPTITATFDTGTGAVYNALTTVPGTAIFQDVAHSISATANITTSSEL